MSVEKRQVVKKFSFRVKIVDAAIKQNKFYGRTIADFTIKYKTTTFLPTTKCISMIIFGRGLKTFFPRVRLEHLLESVSRNSRITTVIVGINRWIDYNPYFIIEKNVIKKKTEVLLRAVWWQNKFDTRKSLLFYITSTIF